MKNLFTKAFAVLAGGALTAALCAGCVAQEGDDATQIAAQPAAGSSTASAFVQEHYNFNTPDFLTVDDDIFTYEKLEEGKIPLVVGKAGTVDLEAANERFEQLYPQYQLVSQVIVGGVDNKALANTLAAGCAPDVLLSAYDQLLTEDLADLFVDLSSHPSADGYLMSSLQTFTDGGSLYYLPGPSAAYGIVYNKTMFAEHGWSVPKTYDEFVELCARIETETNGQVDAFNPNAKYPGVFCDPVQAFAYSEVLGDIADASWLSAFKSGEATFSGHMEPLFEAFGKLAARGVVEDADWLQSSTKRMNDFMAGNIAMINLPRQLDEKDLTFEASVMPYPGAAEGADYLVSLPSYAVACPKQAVAPSAQKQKAIDDYLAFLGSSEAQKLIVGESALFPSVKGLSSDAAKQAASEEARAAVQQGRIFQRENFSGSATPPLAGVISEQCRAMVNGQVDAAGACVAVDEYCAAWRAGQLEQEEPAIAQVVEDMTTLEVAEYVCDAMRETSGADVALLPVKGSLRSIISPLFVGDVTANTVTDLKLRGLVTTDRLLTVDMTGAQLRECLDHPRDGSSDEDMNCVFAFSGLRATVAPWMPLGQRYRDVTLADGSELDPRATYTVAFWAGTVLPECAEGAQPAVDEEFVPWLTAAIEADGELAPANDARRTLVWE